MILIEFERTFLTSCFFALTPSLMTLGQVSKTDMASNAVVQSIFTAPKSLAPVVSLEEATLLPGLGIKGDRYALQTGTYSARFLQEPGRNKDTSE